MKNASLFPEKRNGFLYGLPKITRTKSLVARNKLGPNYINPFHTEKDAL